MQRLSRLLPLLFAFGLFVSLQACGGSDSETTPADMDDERMEPEEEEQEAEFEEEEAVRTETLLRFPLADEEGHYSLEFIFGVDHDPEVYDGIGEGICTNYRGDHFPHCYDEHSGSDYILNGGFETMDLGVAFVYAAADGIVTDIEDGHYDRCHIDTENLGAGNISCDGHEIRANKIIIEHEFGLVTKYYHLVNGSLLVDIGDTVTCGQKIAQVGSSGISSAPHLHFQVEDLEGTVIDPYSGEFSQEKSYWVEQDSGNGLPGETCAFP